MEEADRGASSMRRMLWRAFPPVAPRLRRNPSGLNGRIDGHSATWTVTGGQIEAAKHVDGRISSDKMRKIESHVPNTPHKQREDI